MHSSVVVGQLTVEHPVDRRAGQPELARDVRLGTTIAVGADDSVALGDGGSVLASRELLAPGPDADTLRELADTLPGDTEGRSDLAQRPALPPHVGHRVRPPPLLLAAREGCARRLGGV